MIKGCKYLCIRAAGSNLGEFAIAGSTVSSPGGLAQKLHPIQAITLSQRVLEFVFSTDGKGRLNPIAYEVGRFLSSVAGIGAPDDPTDRGLPL